MTRRRYTRQERNDLATRAQCGDDAARAELLESMEGLVVRIAREFLWSGRDIDDLKTDCRMFVLEAIGRFDPNRVPSDFGGQCGYYLREGLRESVRRNTGAATQTSGSKIREVSRQLRPFLAEAEGRGLSQAQALHEASKHFRISERDAAAILNLRSFERVGTDIGDFEPVSEDPGGEDIAHKASMKRAVDALLAGLSPENRSLIQDSLLEGKSVKSIGKDLGVNRETARKRIERAKDLLRAEVKRRGLSIEDFL